VVAAPAAPAVTVDLDAYRRFLTQKTSVAESRGFACDPSEVHPLLKPHQRDIVAWAVRGGRRAVFAAFGLGQTMMQLEILRLVLMKSRSRLSYVRYVAGLQLNRTWTGSDIELVYATALTCRPLEDTRIYSQADGELLSTLPVSITMTDATVKLLVPGRKGIGH